MSRKFHGFTSASAQNFQLDAGAFFKNYDLTKDFAGNSANCLGATRGGGTLSLVPTIRKLTADGIPSNVKGMLAIDEWVCTLSIKVLESTLANLQAALPGSTAEAFTCAASSTSGGQTYTHVSLAETLQSTDFLTNVAWCGCIAGKNNPVIVVLNNAISTGGLQLTTSDKNEGVITLTFTACYDPAALDTVPCGLYYPGA